MWHVQKTFHDLSSSKVGNDNAIAVIRKQLFCSTAVICCLCRSRDRVYSCWPSRYTAGPPADRSRFAPHHAARIRSIITALCVYMFFFFRVLADPPPRQQQYHDRVRRPSVQLLAPTVVRRNTVVARCPWALLCNHNDIRRVHSLFRRRTFTGTAVVRSREGHVNGPTARVKSNNNNNNNMCSTIAAANNMSVSPSAVVALSPRN